MASNIYPKLTEEKLVLEHLLVNVQAAFPNHVLDKLKSQHRDIPFRQAVLTVIPDHALGALMASLSTYLLKSTHTEKRTLSVRTPETWWDHLKHDALIGDNWFYRLVISYFRPPQYKYVTKEADCEIRVCPHNDSYISENNNFSHFEFLQWK